MSRREERVPGLVVGHAKGARASRGIQGPRRNRGTAHNQGDESRENSRDGSQVRVARRLAITQSSRRAARRVGVPPNARVSWGLAILMRFRSMMARPPAGPAGWAVRSAAGGLACGGGNEGRRAIALPICAGARERKCPKLRREADVHLKSFFVTYLMPRQITFLVAGIDLYSVGKCQMLNCS